MDIRAGCDGAVATNRGLKACTQSQQVTGRYPKRREEAADGGWIRGDTSPFQRFSRLFPRCFSSSLDPVPVSELLQMFTTSFRAAKSERAT